ncbi:CoA-binding protein [Oscillatoria amoena NRMC-F 0135]|nr:CoA-binding protein [Oscillatoria amoena NRMC-F 0135]
MESKKTVIFGASPNPSRYAYMAAEQLAGYGYEFVPVGIKQGKVFGETIRDLRQRPIIDDVDTVTMYIGPHNQPEWYDYLISLKPRRIIFNPGSENPELEKLLSAHRIESVFGCTLVMLQTGQY